MWTAVLDRVLRRPLVAAVVSAGVLVALAHPGARHAHRQRRHRRDPEGHRR